MIDRIPTIRDEAGALEPDSVEGALELVHVRFAYPARQDVIIFEDMCLRMEAGKTTALVGGSGSGEQGGWHVATLSAAALLLLGFFCIQDLEDADLASPIHQACTVNPI